jgi:hypothetical protein
MFVHFSQWGRCRVVFFFAHPRLWRSATSSPQLRHRHRPAPCFEGEGLAFLSPLRQRHHAGEDTYVKKYRASFPDFATCVVASWNAVAVCICQGKTDSRVEKRRRQVCQKLRDVPKKL